MSERSRHDSDAWVVVGLAGGWDGGAGGRRRGPVRPPARRL